MSITAVLESARSVSREKGRERVGAEQEFIKAINEEIKTQKDLIAALQASILSQRESASIQLRGVEGELQALRGENARLVTEVRDLREEIGFVKELFHWLEGKLEAHGHHYMRHPEWSHGFCGGLRYSLGSEGYSVPKPKR